MTTGSTPRNEFKTETPALEVRNLKVYYDTPRGAVKAVDDVSFTLERGERLGLVGESGSGKTTIAMALMRLTKPPAHIISGDILLNGTSTLGLTEKVMDEVRLSQIALVPQGAMNSLNPVIKVGPQIIDGIVSHTKGSSRLDKAEMNNRVAELLTSVGLSPAVSKMHPHELSGGMKQRVALAIATSLGPKVIVADEPTSALDVVVQRQIMTTLEKLQADLGASVVLVGHDMGLMAQFADKLGVMYAGKLVELASINEIFENPLHPYTKLLISSLPSFTVKEDFFGIPGLPPTLIKPPSGCRFHPRCPSMLEHCSTQDPHIKEIMPNRYVSCHLYSGEIDDNASS